MKDWRNIVISPEISLRDAIACVDRTGMQMTLVLDSGGWLLGVLSDGDIRRAILRGVDLALPVKNFMNKNPTTAPISSNSDDLLMLMRQQVLHHVPLLDQQGRVVGLATLDELTGILEKPNWVVLMAGGLGARLYPLTEKCPKPMLLINGKPILESIIEKFAVQGYRKIFLAVNYLAEQIKDYFEDGHKLGVEIQYLHEPNRLGTVGALSLLPEIPTDPCIVMNGDLVTRLRFDQMLQFHDDHNAMVTMAVREYDFQVSYGVVNIDDVNILSLDEKPTHKFFVNAGIYTLSPEALSRIPSDTLFDMPMLFEKLIAEKKVVSAYLLREYWLDIGHMNELKRARREWATLESLG